LSHDDVYLPPYGWHVQIPAYLTFIEPVIACLIIYANVEQNLSRRSPIRYLQFILLIMMVRRVLISPFIYIFYSHLSPLTSIASMG
jgi:hypothetical protein